MNNIMIDIETLGTTPGSVILSIGATRFDLESVDEVNTFHQLISVERSSDAGFSMDSNTLDWWNKQNPQAKELAFSGVKEPYDVLLNLIQWFGSDSKTKVWANGANFDTVLLEAYFQKLGLLSPWKYYNVRCFRTLKELCKSRFNTLSVQNMQKHNALEDAIYQAKLAQVFLLKLANDGYF